MCWFRTLYSSIDVLTCVVYCVYNSVSMSAVDICCVKVMCLPMCRGSWWLPCFHCGICILVVWMRKRRSCVCSSWCTVYFMCVDVYAARWLCVYVMCAECLHVLCAEYACAFVCVCVCYNLSCRCGGGCGLLTRCAAKSSINS
jgi:hypothetical protein